MAKQAISQHGVPSQLLSGYEAAFLSNLMPELCTVTGTKKVNTTAYPETDGLVEGSTVFDSHAGEDHRQRGTGLGHHPTLCAIYILLQYAKLYNEIPFLPTLLT